MRIKITFRSEKEGWVGFNYQHQIRAVIAQCLEEHKTRCDSWIPSRSFKRGKERDFDLFVFSGLSFSGPVKISGKGRDKGFAFFGTSLNPFVFSLQVASPLLPCIELLLEKAFPRGREIVLGRQKVTLWKREKLSDPLEGKRGPFTLYPFESPIFVKKNTPPGDKNLYLFPGDREFDHHLNQNLLYKYKTLYGKDFTGKLLTFHFYPPQGKGEKTFYFYKKGREGAPVAIPIKGTLRPFTVSGPLELIKIGMECGFGQENSFGCGYVTTG